jgi:predicted DCC family thiol-disulfide oxidoreductase YuxK
MESARGGELLKAAGVAQPIIFYDDVCVMCNAFVNLVLNADRHGEFLFAPLGGITARKILPPLADDPGQWSMVYVDERGIHDQSDASLEVYRRLGGRWRILSLGQLFPRWIRDPVYRMIARNRYRWFGKHDTCRLPTPLEKARFLD